MRENPRLRVYVHERGALHLEDPARLLASATRLYGDQMQRLWGEFLPVPRENLRPLAGGEEVRQREVAVRPMGIQRVAGRLFEPADFGRGGGVVIDERLLRLYFPGENPVGKRVARAYRNDESTIIGVVRHVAARSLSDADPPGQMYLPLLRAPGDGLSMGRNMAYIVRTGTPPLDLVPQLRRAIDGLSPNVAMARITTLDQVLREARAPAAFTLTLLAIAGAAGLVLAVIGVYGVVTYAVAQRKREIGVRVALGARPRDVAGMVLRQGGTVAVIGLLFGVGGALLAGRLLRALLFGVNPADPLTFAAVSVGLLAVALLACWLPARRAD